MLKKPHGGSLKSRSTRAVPSLHFPRLRVLSISPPMMPKKQEAMAQFRRIVKPRTDNSAVPTPTKLPATIATASATQVTFFTGRGSRCQKHTQNPEHAERHEVAERAVRHTPF